MTAGARRRSGPSLAEARSRLGGLRDASTGGRLEELLETEDFREHLHREFRDAGRDGGRRPPGAPDAHGRVARARRPDRRASSSRPRRSVPYVKAPEELIPGEPLFYATAHRHGGYARGILVESHEGRPTKIEGNELHPASLGGTDVFAQASVLGLYDPDRSQTLTERGEIRPWSAFLAAVRARAREGAAAGRRGTAVPDGHGDLADAPPPDRRRPRRVPEGEVAPVGAGRARERRRGRAPRVRRGRRAAPRLRPRRRHPLARRRLPRLRARRCRAPSATSPRAAEGATHEPALRRRVDAVPDRARAPTIAVRCRPPRSRPSRRPSPWRSGAVASAAPTGSLRRRRRGGPAGAPRREPRRRRRVRSRRRPRARARDQRGARQRRQDRRLRRARRAPDAGGISRRRCRSSSPT